MPILAYAGLRRPYRFERAIPVLCALALALVVVATAGWLAATDRLGHGGPRAHYFLYLLVLLALVVVLARWPWLATVVLVLALVDLSWGLGSRVLIKAGYAVPALLPPVDAEPHRFQWHASLQAVPIPSLRVTSPTGLEISHTSEGTRGRDPAPHALDTRTVVATFGGSTTYDIGAGEGDTWSDRLGEALGWDRTFVVNHGVPGYSTVEHLIQTALYQTKFGKPPRCAIYYVGWNDLRNAHIPKLDPGYADFHLPSQVDSLKVRRIGGSHVTISPLLTVLARLVGADTDTVRYSVDPYGRPPVSGADPALEALYERNIRSISAINRARGIATIWVGQLLNREQLQSDGRYGWLPLVRDRDVWPLLQRLNAILERTAAALGDVYVSVPPASFAAADFVDNGHFSVQGARRFAERLAPAVREACR
ncbi:MAG: GDSL-type esterase/lipase family protein [Reyranella sp.]|nr:GDSL-type esterase/lipase family protein [Reyranella sp.]